MGADAGEAAEEALAALPFPMVDLLPQACFICSLPWSCVLKSSAGAIMRVVLSWLHNVVQDVYPGDQPPEFAV